MAKSQTGKDDVAQPDSHNSEVSSIAQDKQAQNQTIKDDFGLPPELMFNILHRLDTKDKAAVSQVNKQVKRSVDDNLLWKKHLNHNFPCQARQVYDEIIVYKNLFKKTENRHYKAHYKGAELRRLDSKLAVLFKVVRQGDFSQKDLKSHNISDYNSFLSQILTNIPALEDLLGHSLVSAIQDQKLLDKIFIEKTRSVNNRQETLLWACRCNQLKVIIDLIKGGADISQKIAGSKTLLSCAAENGRLEIIERLFNLDTSKKAMIIADNFNAFRRPAIMGRSDVVKKVLSAINDDAIKQKMLGVNPIDDKLNFFIELVKQNHADIFKILLSELDNQNVQSILEANEFELFRLACKDGCLDVVDIFLKEIDPNKKQAMIASINFEAFQSAAEGGHFRITERLLNEIDDIDIKGKMSVFHLEAHNNRRIQVSLVDASSSNIIFNLINELIGTCKNSKVPAQDKIKICEATIPLITNYPLYDPEEIKAYEELSTKVYGAGYKKTGRLMLILGVASAVVTVAATAIFIATFSAPFAIAAAGALLSCWLTFNLSLLWIDTSASSNMKDISTVIDWVVDDVETFDKRYIDYKTICTQNIKQNKEEREPLEELDFTAPNQKK